MLVLPGSAVQRVQVLESEPRLWVSYQQDSGRASGSWRAVHWPCGEVAPGQL